VGQLIVFLGINKSLLMWWRCWIGLSLTS